MLEKALDDPQEEVPVEMTLVHLVQHDDVVRRQARVRGYLSKQNELKDCHNGIWILKRGEIAKTHRGVRS